MDEAITFAHCQVIDKSRKGLVGEEVTVVGRGGPNGSSLILKGGDHQQVWRQGRGQGGGTVRTLLPPVSVTASGAGP